MFIPAQAVEPGSVVRTDVCVVGAGAAGLTLALELLSANRATCLLEGGGLEADPQGRSLCELPTDGLPVRSESRIRSFGGTTTVWTGRWKPHDAIDFVPRPWVPCSGWPLSRARLDPYYARAAALLAAPDPGSFDLATVEPIVARSSHGLLHTAAIDTTLFRWLRRADWDFGKRFRPALSAARSVSVYLNANVVNLEADDAVSRIRHVDVKTFSGNRFRVEANVFVLACGGIENARLLLCSDRQAEGGLGNGHDQVGRWYMDHPKGVAGRVRPYGRLHLPLYWGFESPEGIGRAGIRLSDERQAELGILNSYVLLDPVFEPGRVRKLAARLLARPRRVIALAVRNYMEQAPRPENRVYLTGERDALGNRRPRLDWSIGELDRRTMVEVHRVLAQELKRLSIGELSSPLLEEGRAEWPIDQDASHHMGTTRMGSDPKSSVVDADCRVHGIGNLFVAGSSVFPTSGYANPTATIAALAIRLADLLKART